MYFRASALVESASGSRGASHATGAASMQKLLWDASKAARRVGNQWGKAWKSFSKMWLKTGGRGGGGTWAVSEEAAGDRRWWGCSSRAQEVGAGPWQQLCQDCQKGALLSLGKALQEGGGSKAVCKGGKHYALQAKCSGSAPVPSPHSHCGGYRCREVGMGESQEHL